MKSNTNDTCDKRNTTSKKIDLSNKRLTDMLDLLALLALLTLLALLVLLVLLVLIVSFASLKLLASLTLQWLIEHCAKKDKRLFKSFGIAFILIIDHHT